MQLLFLSGTSAVGKTEALEHIPGRRISLSARVPRDAMGNPSWEDLMAYKGLAVRHQGYILDYFLRHLQQSVVTYADNGERLCYDRHPIDVVAYSKAFGLSDAFCQGQFDAVVSAFASIADDMNKLGQKLDIEVRSCCIDPDIPYVQIPERPPADIRQKMEDALRTELWPGLATSVSSTFNEHGILQWSYAYEVR